MTVRQPPQNLEEEDLERKEWASFIGELRPGPSGSSAHLHVVHVHDVPTVVHVLLQVLVLQRDRRRQSPGADPPPNRPHPSLCSYQVLEDQHQALVGVDDVVQRDDVGVLEVLQ